MSVGSMMMRVTACHVGSCMSIHAGESGAIRGRREYAIGKSGPAAIRIVRRDTNRGDSGNYRWLDGAPVWCGGLDVRAPPQPLAAGQHGVRIVRIEDERRQQADTGPPVIGDARTNAGRGCTTVSTAMNFQVGVFTVQIIGVSGVYGR